MQRRKFVIGMGALASGTAAAVGTGAFSSVEAERDFAVEVAGDADAYLGLTEESHYAEVTSNTVELDFSGENPTDEDGTGVNQDATTTFLHVFSVHNQGRNTVGIQIDRPDLPGEGHNHVHFFVGEQGGVTLSDYDKEDMASELEYDDSGEDDRVLEPGDELKVGLYFNNDGEEWDFDGSFTINALDKGTADYVAN